MCRNDPFDYDSCIIDGVCRPVRGSLLATLVERLHLRNIPKEEVRTATDNPSRHRGYFALRGEELYLLEVIDDLWDEPALMYSDLASLGWKSKLRRRLEQRNDPDFRMPEPADVRRILVWLAGGFNRGLPLRVTWLHEPRAVLARDVKGIAWGEEAPESEIPAQKPLPALDPADDEDYEEPEWITRIREGGWLRRVP